MRFPPLREIIKWLKCLSPILAIFAAFMVGCVLCWQVKSAYVDRSSERSSLDDLPLLELCAQFLTTLLVVLSWAGATVLNNRKLHCGGSRRFEQGEPYPRRYGWLFFVYVASIFLAHGFLMKGRILEFSFFVFIPAMLIVGEVTRGENFFIFKYLSTSSPSSPLPPLPPLPPPSPDAKKTKP